MLNGTGTSYLDNITYYDGLGRPFQTVEKAVQSGLPVNKNLATLQEYDAAGREWNSWLPVFAGSSDYLAPAGIKSSAPGNYDNDSRPYSQPVYKASPLNRLTAQYGPGAAWYNAGRPVKTEYLLNTNASPLKCIKYGVSSTGGLTGNSTTFYTSGELSVVKTTDEDLNVSYSFTDKQGRTVLTRQMNNSEEHDTYYIYNDNMEYMVIEHNFGTIIYSPLVNMINEIDKLSNIDNLIIDLSYNNDIDIIDKYLNKEHMDNTYTGFFDKKTIYKLRGGNNE